MRQLIENMLLELPDDDQDVLAAASVVGARFSAAAAAAAWGADPEEVEMRFATLSRRGLFVVSQGAETWPDGTVSTRFAFTHDLCREVLYDGRPAGRRASMHARVGRRLEDAWGDRVEEIAPLLASHFARSPDGERACAPSRARGGCRAAPERPPRGGVAPKRGDRDTAQVARRG